MAQHLLPLHTPSCPREQGGSCEGPSSDLSPRACWLHTVAQRHFYEGQFAHRPAHSRVAVSPMATQRGTSARVHMTLGKGCAAKRGVCVGNGEGDKDGGTNRATTTRMVAQSEWLQRSLLVLRQGKKKGFLGPELQNLVTWQPAFATSQPRSFSPLNCCSIAEGSGGSGRKLS